MRASPHTTSRMALSPHAPVVSAGYSAGQARVGSSGPPRGDLDTHAAIRLTLEGDGEFTLVFVTPDHTICSIFGGNPHTFILCRPERRAPRTIPGAGGGAPGSETTQPASKPNAMKATTATLTQQIFDPKPLRVIVRCTLAVRNPTGDHRVSGVRRL